MPAETEANWSYLAVPGAAKSFRIASWYRHWRSTPRLAWSGMVNFLTFVFAAATASAASRKSYDRNRGWRMSSSENWKPKRKVSSFIDCRSEAGGWAGCRMSWGVRKRFSIIIVTYSACALNFHLLRLTFNNAIWGTLMALALRSAVALRVGMWKIVERQKVILNISLAVVSRKTF